MKTQASIILLLLSSIIGYAKPNKKGLTLREAFEGYHASASARDAEAVKSYISNADTVQFVDSKGNIMLDTEKYMEHIDNWLKDTAWKYESNIADTKVYGNTGIVVENARFYGQNWEYPMVITYIFKNTNGYWKMVSDICTEVKTEK